MKKILISLDDTSGIEKIASRFNKLNWEIICTKETCSILSNAGIPVTSVETFTGVFNDYGIPPTLHPKMETALAGNQTDFSIDIVFDIPYPVDKGNDVGGLTLLALAAKGKRIPVMTREDMEEVLRELESTQKVSDLLKNTLINKANRNIAEHYIELLRQNSDFGDGIVGVNIRKLINGENPYQKPCNLFAVLDDDLLSIHKFKLMSGESPCFTNIADFDCIIHTLCLAQEAFQKYFKKTPYLAIAAKHGNPCGFTADWQNPAIVIEKALFGNPSAIWGGEFITNFAITDDYATMLFKSETRKEKLGDSSWMLDLIAAPSFSKNSLAILGKRGRRKLFENKALESPKLHSKLWDIRPVRGGFLRQPPLNYILDFNNSELIGSNIDDEKYGSLILAWATAWSSSLGGNEIALVKNLQLIGAGGGPSTYIAANNAIMRAQEQGHVTKDSVFAANAFFPYIDAPEILIKIGCTTGLVPKGGTYQDKVCELFQNKNINIFFLNEIFRGFSRH